MEHDVLGILHGLEKVHHYVILLLHKGSVCHHKWKANSSSTQQRFGHIASVVAAHYAKHTQVHIICKPGPDIYIMNWLSHNDHTESRDQEITWIRVNVNAISTSVNIPVCKSIEDIQAATCEDINHLELMAYIIQGWPHKKEEVNHSMLQYWPIRNKLIMRDATVMKDKRIIIPFWLQKQIL